MGTPHSTLTIFFLCVFSLLTCSMYGMGARFTRIVSLGFVSSIPRLNGRRKQREDINLRSILGFLFPSPNKAKTKLKNQMWTAGKPYSALGMICMFTSPKHSPADAHLSFMTEWWVNYSKTKKTTDQKKPTTAPCIVTMLKKIKRSVFYKWK